MSLSTYSLCKPSWKATSNPTFKHYRNVAERRVIEGRRRQRNITTPATAVAIEPAPLRPLEDPYLVGETAAAAAKRERLARETTDDVLLVEDRRWDWFLGISSLTSP